MKTRKLLAMLLSLAMVIGLMTPAAMATDGIDTVEKLKTAISAAAPGDTITLAGDIETSEIITINKAITLDLNSKTVTATCQKAFEIYATDKVVIENGTIIAKERAVDTRVNANVEIENCTLSANGSGNTQPITIGGSTNGTKLAVKNSSINAGNSGYGIIVFVGSEIAIENSTAVAGYGALYFKPSLNNNGGSCDVTVENSSLDGYYHAGEEFGVIVTEANLVEVNVINSSLNGLGNPAVLFSDYEGATPTGNEVNISGTSSIDGSISLQLAGSNNTVSITGGTYTVDPSEYVADGYVAMEEVGGTYGVYPAVPVSYVTGTSTNIDGQIVSPGYTFVLPAAPSRTGYTFTGWNDGSATYNAGAEYTVDDNATSVTLTAQWSQNVSSGGSSSGSSSSSNTTTTTEKNPDGSTTTTTTNKTTGTVTETTKNTDGSTSTVETKKDGSSTETNKAADGTTGVTKTDADGNVTEVSANVPAAAAKAAEKADEPVTLPIEVEAADSNAEATEIQVNVPSTGATVEIPVENVTPGTVVVIVNADGTESIVPLTTLTEDGVVVTLEDDATIKVIENSKDFSDVPDDYALADSIDFVSARGLFEGNTETTFNPHADTTIAQTMTVLARLSGEDFYGAGATAKGAEWATEKGLSDGTDVSKAITREQMVVMMWKLAGMPESDHPLTASDVNEISADALTAMQWAVEMGILKGNLDGTIDPNGNASRAHVAAFSERYVNAIAK